RQFIADKSLVARFALADHRLNSKPRKRFGHYYCRSPPVLSIKNAHPVRVSRLRKFVLQSDQLRIIEIQQPGGGKNGECRFFLRRRVLRETGAAQKHAGRAFAELRELRSDARAAGKSCKVN